MELNAKEPVTVFKETHGWDCLSKRPPLRGLPLGAAGQPSEAAAMVVVSW